MKPPKSLIIYLCCWAALWLFNTVAVFVDLDSTITAFMDQIQAANINFSAEKAKSVFVYTTAFISFCQLMFAFGLYRGVAAVRIVDLVFKFLGLPFSAIGLLSFAGLGLLEQFQSLASLGITVFGIVVLLRRDVKEFFNFDHTIAQQEVSESDIDAIEEKL